MKRDKQELLVIGNWKMNPSTVGAARKIFLDISKNLGRRKPTVEVAVAPPFPFISELERLSPSKRIILGAQDVFYEAGGAHTGEVSLSMLKSVGVELVISGHSERRALGETEQDIYKDVQAILKYKATAVVCVGEMTRDQNGHYFNTVESQLRSALKDVKINQLKNVVVAYEPVWAIGTGDTATPEDAHEMKLFIQKILTDRFGRSALKKVRVVYGGSVNSGNAETLLREGGVDGFLVGGASLKGKEFAEIVKTADRFNKENAKTTKS